MREWTQPSFIEIDMSAEIGGYQGDDQDRDAPDHMPDFLTDEVAQNQTL